MWTNSTKQNLESEALLPHFVLLCIGLFNSHLNEKKILSKQSLYKIYNCI